MEYSKIFEYMKLAVIAIVVFVEFMFGLYGIWILVQPYLHNNSDTENVIQAHRPEQETPRAATQTPPKSRRLKIDTYIHEKRLEPGGCGICLEEYKDGETGARITTCDHRFHALCIQVWLAENDTCPLCRSFLV